MDVKEVRDKILAVSELSKRYIGLTEEDVGRLHDLADRVLSKKDEIISNVMSSERADPEAMAVFERTGHTFERQKVFFEQWLAKVFEDNYDEEHALWIFRIGLAHVKVRVDEKLMIDTMAAFEREILKHIDRVEDAVVVSKALYWNLSIMIYSYELIKEILFEEMMGIRGKVLLNRLNDIFSKKVYKELLKVFAK